MATTKLDSRQVISLDALSQLTAGVEDVELDNILRSIDSDLTSMLRLTTDDLSTVSVGAILKINPQTGQQSSLSPINGVLPTFPSGAVVFPAAAGGNITVTPGNDVTLTMSINSFIKVGIHLEDSGNLLVNLGTESGTEAGATVPAALPNSVSAGYVVLATDGLGAISNILGTAVYQYISLHTDSSAQSFQDRGVKLIGGGTWSWDINDLTLSASAYVQLPGLTDTSNEVSAQTITLAANEVAYVTINRSNNTPTTLAVSTADIAAVPQSNDTVIIARRDGSDIIVGTSSFRLRDTEKLELDGALAEINRRLDQLKLLEDSINADQVLISGADIAQLDGTVLGQELNNVLMDFTGAAVNFTTGTISGDANGINFVPATIPVGEYFWYGIAIVGDSVGVDNRIGASVQITPAGSANAVQASAELPLIVGSKKLGAVQVWNNGGTLEVVEIRRLGVGSGSGGEGDGGGAPVEPAIGFNMAYSDELDVGPTSTDSLVRDTETNASHNLSKSLFTLECDGAPTYTATGTNVLLSVAASYTIIAGDIIYITSLNQWRKISNVNSQTDVDIDVAFSVDPAAEAGMVSQAVWTKDLINSVGDATQTTRPRDFYPNETITQVNLDYFDSLLVDDDVPDFIDNARIVASISQQGLQADVGLPASDDFTSIYTRPNAPEQILNYPLSNPGDRERLFTTFFCNPANANVASNGFANLIKYKISFYEDEVISNGGILDSAYCMSDGSGIEINCLAPTVSIGQTYVELDWFYIGDINTGETQGDLTVLVNGQEIPRFVAGATTDAWYEEVPGNNKQIRFYTDLSVSVVSIEVYRRQGSIDTSSENSQDLANIQQSQYISTSITLERKKYQRVATDTSGGALTVTMPATPLPGDIVKIQDMVSSWVAFNVTVNRNGTLIEGIAGDDILDINRAWIEYEYYDAIQGWITRI